MTADTVFFCKKKNFHLINPSKNNILKIYGIGTFQSINPSGQYCYDFGLGYVIKVFNQPQGPQGPAFYY